MYPPCGQKGVDFSIAPMAASVPRLRHPAAADFTGALALPELVPLGRVDGCSWVWRHEPCSEGAGGLGEAAGCGEPKIISPPKENKRLWSWLLHQQLCGFSHQQIEKEKYS